MRSAREGRISSFHDRFLLNQPLAVEEHKLMWLLPEARLYDWCFGGTTSKTTTVLLKACIHMGQQTLAPGAKSLVGYTKAAASDPCLVDVAAIFSNLAHCRWDRQNAWSMRILFGSMFQPVQALFGPAPLWDPHSFLCWAMLGPLMIA